MFIVGGTCDAGGQKLCDVSRLALDAAIARCGPGVPIAAIADAIGKAVAKNSTFRVVDEFTGHGIGTEFHMMPYIIHTRNDVADVMREGHTFTIEPVLVEGSTRFKILADGWTAVSLDKGRGSQIEHTILITSNGSEILTKPARNQQ